MEVRGETRKRRRAKTAPPVGFTDPHVLRGIHYAEDVVSGRINVCKWTGLACQRQLDDLKRQGDPAFPFRFDEALAGRAARFFEQLPHTQGPLSYRRDDGSWNTLVLEPWQCFTETTLYGWVRTDSPPNRPVRRFTRSYEELPRGNGKSFKLSGALLYSFTEGEQGVEAYSAAVDRDQAIKVYGEAEAMLLKRSELAAELGLETSAHAIFQKLTHSYAKALSREAKKTGDGKNVYFAAVDELHAHPTRDVWGVLDTGTGKRAGNALIRIITTAGFNTAGVCFEKRGYVKKILEGAAKDDSWFGIIYTIDEADDWTDEACRAACADHSHPRCVWRKANPNWGVSVDPLDFEGKARVALQTAQEQTNFLTKHLDVWCNADQAWMDMRAWDRCADASLREEDFGSDPCFIGLDLAWTTDLCAKVKLFTREVEREGFSERHYFAFLASYLPEDAIRNGRNDQYRGWAREGRLIVTGDNETDYSRIVRDIIADRDRFDVKAVCFDPPQAIKIAQELQDEGLVCQKVNATVLNFSAPMKELDAVVRAGRFHHDGNPVFRWSVSNVVAHLDAKDNIYPRKERPENKIDPVVACIIAMSRAMVSEALGSYLESERLMVL